MSQKAKQLIAQAKAKKWTRLDLRHCGLTDLATQIPELFELTDLEELDLEFNQLHSLEGLSKTTNQF
jgi:Leucine-rich repeat (LRR) protein